MTHSTGRATRQGPPAGQLPEPEGRGRAPVPRQHPGAPGHTRLLALLLALVLLGTACTPSAGGSGGQAPPTQSAAPAAVPNFGRVFVLVMENKNYDQVIGSADAPFINQLGAKYGLATTYYGVAHPSLPNYLAIVSGSTQGVRNDCETCSYDGSTIVDQLEEHGKTWKAYVEDLPQPCFNGGLDAASTNKGGKVLYVRRHSPLMYFKSVSENPARCNNVVPLTGFAADLQANRLPDFVWVTPNLVNDMHDGTVRQGDNWLAAFIAPILASPAWQEGGVLFLVWDEASSGDEGCCGFNDGGGHTIALVVAPNGKPGYKSAVPYNHYSVLRTVEEAWGLGYLRHSGDAATRSMGEFFK